MTEASWAVGEAIDGIADRERVRDLELAGLSEARTSGN